MKRLFCFHNRLYLEMSKANPNDFRDLIAVFEEGLAYHLIDKQTVIAWADKCVTEDDHPDIFFIELCLMGNSIQEDVISYLRDSLPEGYAGPARPLFAMLYEKVKSKQLKLTEVNSTLHELSLFHDLARIESDEINSLQYKADMVEYTNAFTVKDITEELLSFLEIYKEYTLDNYSNWSSLDNKTDAKLELLKEKLNKPETVGKSWWERFI